MTRPVSFRVLPASSHPPLCPRNNREVHQARRPDAPPRLASLPREHCRISSRERSRRARTEFPHTHRPTRTSRTRVRHAVNTTAHPHPTSDCHRPTLPSPHTTLRRSPRRHFSLPHPAQHPHVPRTRPLEEPRPSQCTLQHPLPSVPIVELGFAHSQQLHHLPTHHHR